MSDYTDNPFHRAFVAGQEQLRRESCEAEARAEAEAREEVENRGYDMSGKEGPEQRLARANSVAIPQSTEPPLTREERRGLSEAEYEALRPELRLEIYNAAMFQRHGLAKKRKKLWR